MCIRDSRGPLAKRRIVSQTKEFAAIFHLEPLLLGQCLLLDVDSLHMQVSDMPMTRQVVSHDSPVQSGIESYRHYTVAENLCWARKEFRFQRDAK